MFTVSCTGLVILLILFIVFLVRGYFEDREFMRRSEQQEAQGCSLCSTISGGDLTDPKMFHKAVIETVKYENVNGEFAKSKVKRILTSARDQIVRGVIIGALDGSAVSALQGAVVWSLSGGIVSGIGDMFGWRAHFY